MPLEQAARVARVLAEHDVGGSQLGEHAQGHVLEVPDRRRADRERHQLSSSASKATKAAPIRPAAVPSSAFASRTELRIGSSASRRATSSAGPAQVVEGRDAEAAAEQDELRREDVDERADARAEVAADLLEQLLRLRVALVREPDEPVRVGRGAERLLRRRGRRAAAHVRLQVATTGARALARPAAVDDHDVAELRALAVPAAERPAAGDDAAADAGPEREHHEVVLASAGARAPLADRGRVRVVVEPDRDARTARACGRAAARSRAAG